MFRFLIAGGGTGGHLFPAIAIKEAIAEKYPGSVIQFVGTRSGLEARVLPSRGENVEFIWISGFARNNLGKNILLPLKIVLSLFQSLVLLLKFRPSVVIGTGGFVTGPVVFVAQVLRIPTILQEQNSSPGWTTRKLSSRANAVCLGNSGAIGKLWSRRIEVTGNPIQKSFLSRLNQSYSDMFKLDSSRKTVLMFGGSLGAKSINISVAECLEKLLLNYNIIWQTGKSGIPQNVSRELITKESQLKHLLVLPFIEDMPSAYAAADIAVCRAGAMTLAELAICGLPAILIPFPFAADDHQTANAQSFVNAGAARLILDKELSGEKFLKEIDSIVESESALQSMSSSMKTLAAPNAADRIAEIASEYLPK